MPPRGVLLSLFAAIAWAGLTACTTTPAVPVPVGSRIVIRLYDGATGIELALANESYPELKDLYSRSQRDASLKRAPDQLIGELLFSLDKIGLRAYGAPGRPAEPRGGDSYLLVEQNGINTVFPKPSNAAPVEERRAYSHIKLVMNEYYRHVGSKQHVNNPDGAAYFRVQP